MDIQKEFEESVSLLRQTVEPLLKWYAQNARILPWRENTDPYRIWVSEIMLQQTRVDTVIPYYERFLQQLPTIKHLAEVPEDSLLKLWEGLGYYSRVKNMQKAARVICEEYGGVFPPDYTSILKLPGIGPYTAGAVCSIAFSQPVPAVDGNVLRVISRITESDHDIGDPNLKKIVTKALKEVYPKIHCGDFTQSLMELGALICIPNGFPKCDICPLNQFCGANIHHSQLSFPVVPEKKQRKKQDKTVFILQCNQQIAVRKREPSGLLGGLWELPNAEGVLSIEQSEKWLKNLGVSVNTITELPNKKHIFSHVEWQMHCYFVDCQRGDDSLCWVSRKELDQDIALPTAFKKCLI